MSRDLVVGIVLGASCREQPTVTSRHAPAIAAGHLGGGHSRNRVPRGLDCDISVSRKVSLTPVTTYSFGPEGDLQHAIIDFGLSVRYN